MTNRHIEYDIALVAVVAEDVIRTWSGAGEEKVQELPVLLVVTILSITQAKVLAQGDSSYLEDTSSIEYLKAKVIGVEDMVEQVDGSYDYTIESQLVEAEITQGQHQGTIIKTISYKSGNPGYDLDIEPGIVILLAVIVKI